MRSRPLPSLSRHILVPSVATSCVAAALFALTSVAAHAPEASAATRSAERPLFTQMTRGVNQNLVVVKLGVDSGARIRDGRVVSLTGFDLAPLSDLVASVPGAVLAPRFSKPEGVLDEMRRDGEARTKQSLPDLNLYAMIELPSLADDIAAEARLADLLTALDGVPGVEMAWAEPIAQPGGFVDALASALVPDTPAVSMDAPSTRSTPLGSSASMDTPETGSSGFAGTGTTPDFSPLQGYLYDAPVGIEAETAWTFPGGLGAGVDFLDLEWGWLFAHEDLPDPFYAAGDYGTDDHGTAVYGEVAGIHNGFGINGIAADVRAGVVSLNTFSIPDAILEAGTVLDPGSVFLMEVQCSGPENWMPCEWWQDVFDAIQVVTATGVICVEAGGNGTVNLDDALYGDLFDRRVRDSGAIVVGAGTPNELTAEWFSNYGSRTDLQGWGSSIVTTCCGDLQGGDPEVRYTAGFNGTSGASPIVTGAIASLQGQALALFGVPMTPDLVEEIFSATGSAWTGDRQIGERPNLELARDRLVLGYGNVDVLVRDGDTLEPLDGRVIEVVETGRLDKTGPTGETSLQLSATNLTIRAEGDFFYLPSDVPVTVVHGETQSITIELFRAPFGSIEGVVRNSVGTPVPDATVELFDAPLSPVSTDPSGAFVLDGVPQNTGYLVTASGVPGLGVGYAELDVVGEQATEWSPVLPTAETFESDGGGYTAFGEWDRGTPNYPSSNPPPTFSGANVWGTDIHGPYDDVQISHLTSPVLDTSDAEKLILTFHHWYWVDPDDGGQVQVWDAGQNRWVVVDPVGGYPDDSIQVLVFTGGYNGYTVDGYVPAVFDLSSWMGGDFQFRFYFRSNVSGHKLGWYVDDVALDMGLLDPADISDFTAGSGDGLRVYGVSPNPFRGTSTLSYSLSASTPVRVELFAADGAVVRRIDLGSQDAGRHDFEWDGRDDAGREISAGTYFYRVRAGSDDATGRIVRLK